jgi:hypothetical protein
VLFYSTTLLSPLFPSHAAYLAFYLTAFNASESPPEPTTFRRHFAERHSPLPPVMTFPPIYLVHALGPRRLLLLSAAGMCVSCVELGWAINTKHSYLAAAVRPFVTQFALLGSH